MSLATADFNARRNRFAADKAAEAVRLRAAWDAFLGDLDRMTARLIATDGVEAIEALDIRATAKRLKAEGFAIADFSVRRAADGVLFILGGLLEASLPARRFILATLLRHGTDALRALIEEERTRMAVRDRLRAGERD